MNTRGQQSIILLLWMATSAGNTKCFAVLEEEIIY